MTEDSENNYFTWEYFYNGGGVAICDFDNDGKPDIYFTGNMVEDKLYRNTGDLKFEDITASAIKSGQDGWHTGVTYGDVNGDGFQDIYVCRGGKQEDTSLLRNLLYINNGDFTFTESAAQYGIDDPAHSIQAAFFDFDLDGDLDLYVMNHPPKFNVQYTAQDYEKWLAEGSNISDNLYRNDDGQFVNISREAGINNHSFGLGLSVSDINNDGWPDLYVANDYDEGDYLYINQKDGTFKNEINERIKHISNFGMGTDIADFNNDGNLDIVEMDMAFSDHVRSKRNMAAMSTEKFVSMVQNGKHYQYMVNTLQLNNGNHTFAEVAQLAGVAKTDWSWAPLLADFDLDGDNDLLITNGFRRDTKDRDFHAELESTLDDNGVVDFDALISMVPETKVKNFLYENNGNLTFSDRSTDWGFDEAFNSNGAAYSDLDGDGDLDLIVNNLDAKASVYENNASNNGRNYLIVNLKGTNTLGARVTLEIGDQKIVREAWATRGYQSAVDQSLHFGMDNFDSGKITIAFGDGSHGTQMPVGANEVIAIDLDQLTKEELKDDTQLPLMVDRSAQFPFTFKHNENSYIDFDNEVLIPHMQSRHGPFVGAADVNSDGLEDLFLGGAANQASTLLLQNPNGGFKPSSVNAFEADKASEDLGHCFFDADGDGDLDLYVVSGGNEFKAGDAKLKDRLYINNGSGEFTKSAQDLPAGSGMTVIADDIDKDGDQDLFIGGRITPQRYPEQPASYLLLNDGGIFTNVIADNAPELEYFGMITKALFTDYDGDGDNDLLVAGEWTPLQFFVNEGGNFSKASNTGLEDSNGWWFGLAEADIDGDGDMDYLAGNLGWNNKFKASIDHPFNVYASDFDKNGSLDIVLSKYQGDINYPVRGKECSSEQVPQLEEKFPTFKEFAEADIFKVYGKEEVENALHLEVKTFSSSYVQNNGDGTFTLMTLPSYAQLSPLNDFIVRDINGDGHLDVITAGNLFDAEVETVRYDAGAGICLIGDGQGNFTPATLNQTGFFAPGNVKDLQLFEFTSQKLPVVLVANNDGNMQVFQLVSPGAQ